MTKRKRGGQPGNKNAVGNRGGGAPFGNQNAFKYGLYKDARMWRKMNHYIRCQLKILHTNTNKNSRQI